MTGVLDLNNFEFPPYVLMIAGTPGTPTPGECNNGFYYSYVTNYKGNFAINEPNSRVTTYYNFFVDVNGVIKKFCTYQEADNNGVPTGATDIFPGCIPMSNLVIPQEIEDAIQSCQ